MAYSSAEAGVLVEDLRTWIEYANGTRVKTTVLQPLHREKLLEYDREVEAVYISPLGIRDVETRIREAADNEELELTKQWLRRCFAAQRRSSPSPLRAGTRFATLLVPLVLGCGCGAQAAQTGMRGGADAVEPLPSPDPEPGETAVLASAPYPFGHSILDVRSRRAEADSTGGGAGLAKVLLRVVASGRAVDGLLGVGLGRSVGRRAAAPRPGAGASPRRAC